MNVPKKNKSKLTPIALDVHYCKLFTKREHKRFMNNFIDTSVHYAVMFT